MVLMDLRSLDGIFMLFVVLFIEEVCILCCFFLGIYVNEVKGKLEVVVGLFFYIYWLIYLDGECFSDKEWLFI